jgi:hypothetical protein
MSFSFCAQTENKKRYEYLYKTNPILLDSLTHVLKLETTIDSIIKESNTKHTDYNPLLSSICIFSDSTFTSDQTTTKKVWISIIDHNKKWHETIELQLNHCITFNLITFCHIGIEEQSMIYNAPETKSKEFYTRQEMDKIENIIVLEKYKDKNHEKWVKLSFTLSKFNNIENRNTAKQTITGWTKSKCIYIEPCY